jgi:hypothetical protein
MERLHRQLGSQGLVVVAVNVKESGQQVAGFMRKYGLTFPALLDLDGRVSSAYRVWGLPVTYLIDGRGQIIGMRSGSRDWAAREVVDVFRGLLGDRESSTAGVFYESGPLEPLPASLRVKLKGSALYAQQEAQSELIGRLEAGEELIPLGKASGAGEAWYMVKTRAGIIGWVKASHVEEKTKTK